MSTIPKEIQDKIAEKFPKNMFGTSAFFRHGAEYGYQLATDGREEFEKENEAKTTYIKKLEKLIDNDIVFLNEKTEQIRQLQASLKEKEEVNRGLQNACKKWETICEELKAENERLKGRIPSANPVKPKDLT